MAVASAFLPTLSSSSTSSSSAKLHQTLNNVSNFKLFPNFTWKLQIRSRSKFASSTASSYRTYRGRFAADEEEDEFGSSDSFNEAVELFNSREYYKCHDVLEALWNKSEEPARTLVHGILQCAVGFHHLFNRNHKGAMMELGEGVCKLRKMNFENGPFLQFEKEISAVLNFIYQTQLEVAACIDDLCITMDQSERSYQLLGGYAAGQHLYRVSNEDVDNNFYLVFCPENFHNTNELRRIKIPILQATKDHLLQLCNN